MKLRDILKTEKEWTKGHYARNKEDEPVSIYDVDACKFCLIGAYHRSNASLSSIVAAISKLFPDRGYVTEFNDHRETTFDDVCKVIELAGV
jgi:hypothetical protein